MNLWQVLRQLRYMLGRARWEGDSNNGKVLRVVCSAGTTQKAKEDLRLPFALLAPLGGDADVEQPNLWTEEIQITVVAGVEGDDLGEPSLIGGVRTGGQGTSKGRGILEIEEEVARTIALLSSGFGVTIQGKSRRTGGAVEDTELGYIVSRVLNYSALVAAFRYYHPAERFRGTTPGGGQAVLAWDLPPDRFDRRMMVLRRAAGATAPANPTAGDAVALASDLATGVTDTPGAGTWSYALFAAYREHVNPANEPPTTGTPDRYSSARTLTLTVT